MMMLRNSCINDHSTHLCGHSNIKLCGHVNTKAQGLFPHSDRTSVSKIALLSSYAHIRVHFRHFGKKIHCFHPSGAHFFFFFKNLLCFDPWIFQRKLAVILFQKHVAPIFSFLSLLFCFVFFYSFYRKSLYLGKVVSRDYTLSKEQKRVNEKKTIHKALIIIFLFQTNHHNTNMTIC